MCHPERSEGSYGSRVNNDALTRLMEEVAKGSTDWNCIIDKGIEDKGLELPNSPSFLIGEYLRRLDKLSGFPPTRE